MGRQRTKEKAWERKRVIPASWDPQCEEPRSHRVGALGISAGRQEASDGGKCHMCYSELQSPLQFT